MATATVSSKYQVVIPREVREKLGIRAGDQLIVEVDDGKVVMHLRPRSYTRYMLGLGKEVWRGVDATEYVRKERGSWER